MLTRVEVRSSNWNTEVTVVTTFEPTEDLRSSILELAQKAEATNKVVLHLLQGYFDQKRSEDCVQSINCNLNWLRENGFAVPSNIVVEQKQAMQIEHKETPNGE
jgi:hypothetical protein